MVKMGNKRVLLFGYSKGNLGDDLFVYILTNKYKQIDFFIHVNNEKYRQAFSKIKNLHCLTEERNVDNINIDEYDAFVYVGGSIFIESDYGWHEAKEFNNFLKKVKEKNKKFFYMTCNFGPYQTEEYAKQIAENLKLCESVSFRDKKSYEKFKDIPTVKYAPDLAFVYNYDELTQEKYKKSVGISVIDLSIREKLRGKELIYLDYIKRIVIKYAKRGYKVALISFCEFEKDEEAIEKVMQILPEEYKTSVSKILYKGNIEEFLKEYSKYEYMVCTRFHAMILSIIFKQKIYNLIYSEKTTNFIKDYNLFRKIDKIKDIEYETYLRTYHFKKISNCKLKKLQNTSQGQVENFEEWLKI